MALGNQCLCSNTEFAFSLRLTEIRVPNHTVRNSTVRLECFYEMEGEDLYSVKWYKDGHEFYRYSPAQQPSIKVFPLAGVTVDVSVPFFFYFVCYHQQVYKSFG